MRFIITLSVVICSAGFFGLLQDNITLLNQPITLVASLVSSVAIMYVLAVG